MCLQNYSRGGGHALAALRRSVRKKADILLAPLRYAAVCDTPGLLQRFPDRKGELGADTPTPL